MSKGKEWSHEDVDTLISMYQQGESCKAISRKLKRSHTAVCYKLGKLSNLYINKDKDDKDDKDDKEGTKRYTVPPYDDDDTTSDSLLEDSDEDTIDPVVSAPVLSDTLPYVVGGFIVGGIVSFGTMSFLSILSRSIREIHGCNFW